MEAAMLFDELMNLQEIVIPAPSPSSFSSSSMNELEAQKYVMLQDIMQEEHMAEAKEHEDKSIAQAPAATEEVWVFNQVTID